MLLTLDRFGRVVLPKAIRNELGLRPGDVLEAERENDTIVLRPSARKDYLRREGRILVFAGRPAGNFEGLLKNMREERVERTFSQGR